MYYGNFRASSVLERAFDHVTQRLEMSNNTSALEIARAAKAAFEASQLIASSERIIALNVIKDELTANKEEILAANRQDLEV